MNNLQANELIKNLYNAVDSKDLNYLDKILSEDVNFRIGNYDTISDKAAVLEANDNFFKSITKMSHTIENVWNVEKSVLCNGIVDYIRLDGSEYSAYFSTVLSIENEQIVDYFIYVDISKL